MPVRLRYLLRPGTELVVAVGNVNEVTDIQPFLPTVLALTDRHPTLAQCWIELEHVLHVPDEPDSGFYRAVAELHWIEPRGVRRAAGDAVSQDLPTAVRWAIADAESAPATFLVSAHTAAARRTPTMPPV